MLTAGKHVIIRITIRTATMKRLNFIYYPFCRPALIRTASPSYEMGILYIGILYIGILYISILSNRYPINRLPFK